jgi:molybdopterin converting factor small subunit
MHVTVHYFGVLAEGKHLDFEEVEVAAGTTLRALYERAFPPERLPPPPPVLFVQDEDYVAGETPVRDGAVIAFIPPLGGG